MRAVFGFAMVFALATASGCFDSGGRAPDPGSHPQTGPIGISADAPRSTWRCPIMTKCARSTRRRSR